jgi:DNA primase
VSAPVSWEEVRQCRDESNPELLSFETGEVLERVARDGDQFAMLLSVKQDLPRH